MTSKRRAFRTTLYRAALAACLLTAFTVDASAQSERYLLAGEAVIDEPTQPSPPPTRPSEEQTPQQSDQPKERKRTYDGPPRDELLPIARRLPA
jgi:hypothetical protein